MLSVKGHSLLVPVVVCARGVVDSSASISIEPSRRGRLPARLILGIQMVGYKA